jgi:hypothetical protein
MKACSSEPSAGGRAEQGHSPAKGEAGESVSVSGGSQSGAKPVGAAKAKSGGKVFYVSVDRHVKSRGEPVTRTSEPWAWRVISYVFGIAN